MSTPRTFSQPKPQRQEPIVFEIEGEYVEDNEGKTDTWSERFVARRSLPPGVLLDLMSLITINADGSQRYNMAAIASFMTAVLIDDDNRKRWDALIHDEARLVQIESLAEIMQWLATEVAGRPTTR